jgi:phosphorylase kinase alpha/beta subunit
LTRNEILNKLQGRYGCSRFIRDGYKTAKEDPNRLHYEPWELKVFENIECEWPLFWCYLIIDGIFYQNLDQVVETSKKLENVLIKDEESFKLLPELYSVPSYKVDEEYKNPKSQDRVALGKVPHLWGQSLYIIGKLLQDNLIAPGELDPLNRRLVVQPKPDLVVQGILNLKFLNYSFIFSFFYLFITCCNQVSVLAEDASVQEKLHINHNLIVKTVDDISPIVIYPASVLAHIYSFLGRSETLGFTGRPATNIGYLATSKVYTLDNKIMCFTPSVT